MCVVAFVCGGVRAWWHVCGDVRVCGGVRVCCGVRVSACVRVSVTACVCVWLRSCVVACVRGGVRVGAWRDGMGVGDCVAACV